MSNGRVRVVVGTTLDVMVVVMRRCWRPVLFISCTALVFFAAPRAARAQIDNRLALGGGIGRGVPTSPFVGDEYDFNFELRLGHEHEQWGWMYSFLSWRDVSLDTAPGPAQELGRVRMRPIMVGYGYTWLRGRAAITAGVMGGFAFNSFHLDRDTIAAYERLGASDVRGEATNTFALRPDVQVWYDISPRWGLKVSGGYLVSRPSATIVSTLGRDTRPVKADTILLTVGLVYSIL